MTTNLETETLYAEGKRLVLRDLRPSPSYLSRELNVPHTVADRILRRMVSEGLLEGPFFDRPLYRIVESA